jgi:hypothetical protein
MLVELRESRVVEARAAGLAERQRLAQKQRTGAYSGPDYVTLD